MGSTPTQFFTRVKGAAFHVVGGNAIVEMPLQVDDAETAVWQAAFQRNSARDAPPLLAVHVSPFSLADPVDALAKLGKLRALFEDVQRVAEVNLDTKAAFVPPVDPKAKEAERCGLFRGSVSPCSKCAKGRDTWKTMIERQKRSPKSKKSQMICFKIVANL